MTTHDDTAVPISQSEPIRHDNLLINFTTEFLRIWDTTGSRAKPAAIWRPTPAADALPGYFPLGDVISVDRTNISGRHAVAVVCEAQTPSADPAKGKALRRPEDYELVWNDTGSGSKKDGAIWRPVPPEGYVALGSVCSVGHEKPSLNAVRCVRADLVASSSVVDAVWNDKGSGARQSVSTWTAVPPPAPSDEINLAPGTFVGISGYSWPANLRVYSLRIPITLEIRSRPAMPVLESETPPSAQVLEKAVHTARLPWFAVKDPQFSPRQQFGNSPFYFLQRTDQYQLVGHCHNSTAEKKTFRWTAPRVQRLENLRAFTSLTSINFDAQWQSNFHGPFLFSARINHAFTQSELLTSEWLNATPIEIATLVAKNSSTAVYVMQSDYTLLRTDGTSVAGTVSYTDSNSLHFSEYTPEEPSAPGSSAMDPQAATTTDTPSADNEIAAAPMQTESPTATDNAP